MSRVRIGGAPAVKEMLYRVVCSSEQFSFYSASMLAMQSAVLAIVNPSVRLSVRLSVTRWH